MLIHNSSVLANEGERRTAEIARLNSDENEHFDTNTTFMHKQPIGTFLPGIQPYLQNTLNIIVK